jgi:hypothetical protein
VRAASAGEWGQSGGAAAPRVRPGLRSLRSPAAAGRAGGHSASCRTRPWFAPQAGARASRRCRAGARASRAPAPRRPGPRGFAAVNLPPPHLCAGPSLRDGIQLQLESNRYRVWLVYAYLIIYRFRAENRHGRSSRPRRPRPPTHLPRKIMCLRELNDRR